MFKKIASTTYVLVIIFLILRPFFFRLTVGVVVFLVAVVPVVVFLAATASFNKA